MQRSAFPRNSLPVAQRLYFVVRVAGVHGRAGVAGELLPDFLRNPSIGQRRIEGMT